MSLVTTVMSNDPLCRLRPDLGARAPTFVNNKVLDLYDKPQLYTETNTDKVLTLEEHPCQGTSEEMVPE